MVDPPVPDAKPEWRRKLEESIVFAMLSTAATGFFAGFGFKCAIEPVEEASLPTVQDCRQLLHASRIGACRETLDDLTESERYDSTIEQWRETVTNLRAKCNDLIVELDSK